MIFNILWNEDYEMLFGIDLPKVLAYRHYSGILLGCLPTTAAVALHCKFVGYVPSSIII
jgi:hypothetical protein